MGTWVLLHSPLVGPASLGPLAEQLRARAQRVILPDLTPALAVRDQHVATAARTVAAVVERGPVTLVAHSGAGPLVPVIAEHLAQRHVTRTADVLVDAGMPHPGRSTMDVLPSAMAEQLRAMTTRGWTPPWPSWLPPERLENLVPRAPLRAAFVDDCPWLPISVFTEVHPKADALDPGRCVYIRLSEAYDGAADEATQAGWSVHRIDTHHLAVLTQPGEIVEHLPGMPRRTPPGAR